MHIGTSIGAAGLAAVLAIGWTDSKIVEKQIDSRKEV